ncbi:MAG: hypothetical protein HY294_12155 [Candidatus Rokubacteria bacterium]|nr:hypothetical protein [Candidatus Rokubacteria bacterium]MBI3826743.1 hypothetical protein [Candidatus Rokubacteria bacterium]
MSANQHRPRPGSHASLLRTNASAPARLAARGAGNGHRAIAATVALPVLVPPVPVSACGVTTVVLDGVEGPPAPPRPGGYHGAVSDFKRRLIETTLQQASGNRTHAARTLGLQRTYLLRLMRDLNVDAPPPPSRGRRA